VGCKGAVGYTWGTRGQWGTHGAVGYQVFRCLHVHHALVMFLAGPRHTLVQLFFGVYQLLKS